MSLAVSKDTQLKRARLYPDVIRLHLDEAKLCVNCDTIHTGSSCPSCASTNCFLLSSVIGRMPQNLHLKRHPVSLDCPVKEAATPGSEMGPLSGSQKGSHLMFQFLHLISWLK